MSAVVICFVDVITLPLLCASINAVIMLLVFIGLFVFFFWKLNTPYPLFALPTTTHTGLLVCLLELKYIFYIISTL